MSMKPVPPNQPAFKSATSVGWSEKNHEQWEQTLEDYAHTFFGDSPVREVDTEIVVKALEAIWTKYPGTASRVRGRIGSVLDWVKVKVYRGGENPARWRGYLDQLLPAMPKVNKVQNHIELPYKDVPAFMAALCSSRRLRNDNNRHWNERRNHHEPG